MPKIFIAGDFGYRGRTVDFIKRNRGRELFIPCEQAINDSDKAILNFETPVGEPKHFVPKCGPSLHSDKIALKAIRDIGFSMVTLANNHFFDCGQYGVEKTLEACDEYGLDIVGGGRSYEEAIRPYETFIKNEKIVIINACETEFSIATEFHGGSRALDIIEISQEIIKYKETAKVIVIIHGGHEFYQLPSVRMQKMFRFFIDMGAIAVVNHHQHCYSGYEVYNGHPIFYGLGNFVFDSSSNNRNSMWNYGYAIILDTNSPASFELIPYSQSNESAGIREMSQKEKIVFEETLSKLNEIILDPIKLSKAEKDFFSKVASFSFLNPFFNGLTAKLYKQPWFPSFVSRKQRMYQLHFLQCESHRDILLKQLKESLKI